MAVMTRVDVMLVMADVITLVPVGGITNKAYQNKCSCMRHLQVRT